MSNEVVVTDGSLERILAVEPRPFETAARAALAARARRLGPTDRAGANGGG